MLLLAGITHADCSSAASFQLNSASISSALPISGLALLVSILVVALGYVITKVIPGMRSFEGWLNGEYVEIAKSAFLIAGIFFLLAFLGNVSSSVFGTSYYSLEGTQVNTASYATTLQGLYLASCQYFSNMASQYTTPTLYWLTMINVVTGFWSGAEIGDFSSIPTYLVAQGICSTTGFLCLAPALTNGYDTFVYINSMLTGNILAPILRYAALPAAFIIEFQSQAFLDAVSIAFSLAIPMGIIFRALPLTRPVGGALIGVGVGIAIVYPVLLLVLNYPVMTFMGTVFSPPSPPSAASSSIPFLQVMQNVISQMLPSLANAIVTTGQLFLLIPNQLIAAVNQILVYALMDIVQMMLFILDLAILYPAADSIAKAFGGTVRLSLSGKLKIS